jgi:hypothetical protein
MGYWCPPQSSKLLETCVPGLLGSIPRRSRQLNTIKGSSEFLTYIDQRALGLFLLGGAQMVPLCILVPLEFTQANHSSAIQNFTQTDHTHMIEKGTTSNNPLVVLFHAQNLRLSAIRTFQLYFCVEFYKFSFKSDI